MTKYESKLLTRWPRHHSRGMWSFVVAHSVLYFVLPFAGAFWLCRWFIFHHHTVHWDDAAYSLGVGVVAGVIKSVSLWHKMERLYGDSQKQIDQVV